MTRRVIWNAQKALSIALAIGLSSIGPIEAQAQSDGDLPSDATALQGDQSPTDDAGDQNEAWEFPNPDQEDEPADPAGTAEDDGQRSETLEASGTTTSEDTANSEALPTIPVTELNKQADEDQGAAPDSGRATRLEDVVVTTQKRPETLQRLAGSESVVSGEQISARNLKTLEDITRSMPNVVMSSENMTGSTNVRGMGTAMAQRTDPGVAAIVDEVPVPVVYLVLAFLDIDSVELLRGPQSTLYGRFANAGLFKINTLDPSLDWEAKLGLRYGQFSNSRIDFVGNAPITDNLGLRLRAVDERHDGYIYNTDRDEDDSAVKKQVIGSKLRWDLDSDLTLATNLFYATQNLPHGFGYQAVKCPDYYQSLGQQYDQEFDCKADWKASHDLPQLEDFWWAFGNAVLDWRLGDYNLRSYVAYYKYNVSVFYDADYSPIPLFSLPLLDYGHNVTAELRLDSPTFSLFGRDLSLAGGLYYDQKTESTDYTLNILAPCVSNLPTAGLPNISSVLDQLAIGNLIPCNANTDNPTSIESVGSFIHSVVAETALYAQLTYDISDSLNLRLGGRYAITTAKAPRIENSDTCLGLPTQCILGLAGNLGNYEVRDLKRSDDIVSGSGALRYFISNDLMLYGSVATGFKAGGFGMQIQPNCDGSGVYPDSTCTPEADEFGPEQSVSYEIGSKNTFFDGVLRVNVSAFLTNFRKFQVTTINETGVGEVSNAKLARSKGIELEAMTFLPKGLFLGVSGGFLDSRYVDFANAPSQNGACVGGKPETQENADGSSTTVCNLNGVTLFFAPRWQTSVNLDGRWQPFDWPMYFTAGADAKWQSLVYFQQNGDPNAVQEPFWRFNARAGLTSFDGSWSLMFFVDNITDHLDFQTVGPVPVIDGAYWASANQRRVFFASLNLSF